MKNDYEVRGDITAIIINSPKHGRKEALISTNKLEIVKEFPNTWYAVFESTTNGFYVHGNTMPIDGKRKKVYLHRWVTNAPKDRQVDHINHKGLDNTDDNLRVCTNSENQQNRKGSQANSKSKIRGVCWNEKSKKWRASVKVNYKRHHIGTFDNLKEAEKASIKAREKLMTHSVG